MLARLLKRREENESGFTLIELLVVIIIIGILAAIAIPIFLSQRNKGYDAAIKSDLHTAALAEASYLTDYNTYVSGTLNSTTTALTDEGLAFSNSSNYSSAGVQLIATTNGDQCYVLSGVSASGNTWVYESNKGGLQPKDTAVPASC